MLSAAVVQRGSGDLSDVDPGLLDGAMGKQQFKLEEVAFGPAAVAIKSAGTIEEESAGGVLLVVVRAAHGNLVAGRDALPWMADLEVFSFLLEG